MAIDDYFKQPGAIPFKWEIRPGVPKVHHESQQFCQEHASSDRHNLSLLSQQKQLQNEQAHVEQPNGQEFSFPDTPRKLAPPPGGFSFYCQFPVEPRAGHSFRSAPRTRSERYRLYTSSLAQPVSVSPVGCFPSPLLTRKNDKYKTKKQRPKPEADSGSDLEILSRWSVSSRKSLSHLRDSPLSSSSSSYQSSPRPVNDAEWAGFGLF